MLLRLGLANILLSCSVGPSLRFRGSIPNVNAALREVKAVIQGVRGDKSDKGLFKSVRHPDRSAHLGHAETGATRVQRPFAEV